MTSSEPEATALSCIRRISTALVVLIAIIICVDVLLSMNSFGAREGRGDGRICIAQALNPVHTDMDRSSVLARCVRSNVRIAFNDVKQGVAGALASHPGPCRYVGMWYAWNDGNVLVIELQASGTYTAWPLSAKEKPVDSGTWRYSEGRIRWTHESGGFAGMAASRVRDEVSDGFTLLGINRAKTVFRAAGGQSDHCPLTR